jgi:hypothetical protein
VIVDTIVRALGSALTPVSAVARGGSLSVRTKSAEACGHFHGTQGGERRAREPGRVRDEGVGWEDDAASARPIEHKGP